MRAFATLLALAAATLGLASGSWVQDPDTKNVGTVTLTVTGTGATTHTAPWGTTDAGYTSGPLPTNATSTVKIENAGTIHVRWTWQTSDGTPAPACVIVKRTASAFWSGPPTSVTGTTENGLGSPRIPDANAKSETMSGSKYTVEDGSSGVVDVSWAASATVQANTDGNVQAKVSGGATLYEVRLNLTGVHDPSINDILIGQTLGGNVNCGLAGSGDTYSWNVGGCDPFQSFNIFTSQQTSPLYGTQASPNSSSVTSFTTQTSSLLSTHLRTPGTYTVTCDYYCAAANKSITLSALGRAIAPSDSWGATIQSPQFSLNSTNPGKIILTDATLTLPGMAFDGAVTTPGEFISHDAGSQVGYWCQAQLITPPFREEGSLHPYDPRDGLAANGRNGLDMSFPYETPQAIWLDLSHQYEHSAGGTHAYPSDTPSQSIGTATSVKAFDSFTTWQLYFPPQNVNGGSQYVPLKSVTWYWKGYADNSTYSVWRWAFNPEAAWGYVGDYPTHPIWTLRHSTDFWVFQ